MENLFFSFEDFLTFLNISEPHYFELDKALNQKIEKRCFSLEKEGHLPKSRDEEKIVLKSELKKAVDEYWEVSSLLSNPKFKEEEVIKSNFRSQKSLRNHEMVNLTEN